MNVYERALLGVYNTKESTEIKIRGTTYTIEFSSYSPINARFFIDCQLLSYTTCEPDIKKSFDKAFINVFMSTMPVRIVLADDAAQGPYNYIYLCMAHNGAFWPDAKVDILNFIPESHKCACPNFKISNQWFDNVKSFLDDCNVEFYKPYVERLHSYTGRQIGLKIDEKPFFTMSYPDYAKRFIF